MFGLQHKRVKLGNLRNGDVLICRGGIKPSAPNRRPLVARALLGIVIRRRTTMLMILLTVSETDDRCSSSDQTPVLFCHGLQLIIKLSIWKRG